VFNKQHQLQHLQVTGVGSVFSHHLTVHGFSKLYKKYLFNNCFILILNLRRDIFSSFQARSQNCEKRLLASSCPSVSMEQLGSQWTDFDET
jgi:hypothetical protein